jgi:predicted trehalose synthase
VGVIPDGSFRNSYLGALGNPEVLRDLGGISDSECEGLAVNLMITPSTVAPAAAGRAIAATPCQRAPARLVRCGARKVLRLASEVAPIAPDTFTMLFYDIVQQRRLGRMTRHLEAE